MVKVFLCISSKTWQRHKKTLISFDSVKLLRVIVLNDTIRIDPKEKKNYVLSRAGSTKKL